MDIRLHLFLSDLSLLSPSLSVQNLAGGNTIRSLLFSKLEFTNSEIRTYQLSNYLFRLNQALQGFQGFFMSAEIHTAAELRKGTKVRKRFINNVY